MTSPKSVCGFKMATMAVTHNLWGAFTRAAAEWIEDVERRCSFKWAAVGGRPAGALMDGADQSREAAPRAPIRVGRAPPLFHILFRSLRSKCN